MCTIVGERAQRASSLSCHVNGSSQYIYIYICIHASRSKVTVNAHAQSRGYKKNPPDKLEENSKQTELSTPEQNETALEEQLNGRNGKKGGTKGQETLEVVRTVGKQNCEAEDWTHGFLQVDKALIC